MAYRIFVPYPGIEPMSPTVEAWSPNRWATRGFLAVIFTCFLLFSHSVMSLCNPMDCSIPGFPVFHYPFEFAQTHVHWIGDASSSVVPISSHLLSFPASGSFPVSQFLASEGQSIGGSASASVPPMSIQDRFPLGLADLISLLSKRLSEVFSRTTVRRHQFFGTQPF